MPTEPSKPSSAQACAVFESLLQEALETRGILAQSEVQIAGTPFRIDLFIPSLPRTMVEVKLGRGPGRKGASDLGQVSEYLAALRNELGPAVQAILVRVGPGMGDAVEENLKEGIHLIRIESGKAGLEEAQRAAESILGLLGGVRTRILGLEGPAGWAAAAAAAAVAGAAGAGMAGAATPFLFGLGPFGILMGGGAILAGKFLKDRQKSRRNGKDRAEGSGDEHPGKAPLRRVKKAAPPPVPTLTEAPSSQEVEAVADQARTMLAAYVDLVPSGYPALAHEVDFLVEEFRQGHFTACALRAGRCLESIVYQLAKEWEVEVQDSAFGVVHELKQKVDHLGELVGDHEICPEARQQQLKGLIQQAVQEIYARSTELLVSVLTPRERGGRQVGATAPRTLTMLLKRVRNRYRHLEPVRENIGQLLGREGDSPEIGLVVGILGHRNRAAHAGADGHPQEADRASILPMLTDLNIVIRKLSNAGIAIQQERARQGPGRV